MGNTNSSVKQANVKNTNAETKGQTKLKSEEGMKRVHLDVNNPILQEKLTSLNWYLGIANPVFEPVKKNINVVKNGQTISKQIEKREFDHYSFNTVDGVKLEDWIKNTFGDEYELDPKTKEVYKLVSEGDLEKEKQKENNDPDEDEASVNVVEPSKE